MPPITGTHSCHVILYSLGTKWPPAAAYQERSPVRYVSGSSVARCESARAVGSAVARSWGGPSSANQSRRRPAAATAESAPGQRLPGKVWALSFRFSPCGDGFRFGSGPAGRVLGEEREDWDEPRRQRVVCQRDTAWVQSSVGSGMRMTWTSRWLMPGSSWAPMAKGVTVWPVALASSAARWAARSMSCCWMVMEISARM